MCSNTSYGNGSHHLGSHHYAKLFAANGDDVFWIGGPIHAGNLLRARRGNLEEQEVTETWRNGGTSVQKNIVSYHPFTLLPYRKAPLLGSRAAMRHTLSLTTPALRSVLARQGFDCPDLLWLAQSHASYSALKTIPAKKVAYRVSDSYHEFEGVPESLRKGEQEIIQAADVVFVTAHRLLEETRQMRAENVVYLPNGVDYAHFYPGGQPEPEELKALPRPRILYVGAISRWFNVELMEKTARALPKFSFTLIGRAEIDLSALRAFPNVAILGPRPYTDLPPYLHHSDAAIIPFIKNRLTDATSPIKLYEYSAAGLPVVSVRMLRDRNGGFARLPC